MYYVSDTRNFLVGVFRLQTSILYFVCKSDMEARGPGFWRRRAPEGTERRRTPPAPVERVRAHTVATRRGVERLPALQSEGEVLAQDGTLVASTAQQGLIRKAKKRGESR